MYIYLTYVLYFVNSHIHDRGFKLHRPQQQREKRKLAKRLGGPGAGSSDARNAGGAQNKRQNLGGGQFAEVQPPKQGDVQMKSGGKA